MLKYMASKSAWISFSSPRQEKVLGQRCRLRQRYVGLTASAGLRSCVVGPPTPDNKVSLIVNVSCERLPPWSIVGSTVHSES
jgi:hypothetical protein